MNHDYVQTLISDDIRTVGVKFKDYDKIYTYKYRGMDLQVGDFVVVYVYGDDAQFKIVEVVRVDDVPEIPHHCGKKYKWVVQKVDVQANEDNIQMDLEFSRRLRTMERDRLRRKIMEDLALTEDELKVLKDT